MLTASLWSPRSPKTSSSRSIRLSVTSVSTNPYKRSIPRLSPRRDRIGGCHISLAVRSWLSPTPHPLLLHTSAIRLHTSSFLQPFHSLSHGHTFPITEKTSEPKVHEVSRYSRVVRTIELSHFSFLFLVLFMSCHDDCHCSLRFSAGLSLY